MYRLAVLFIFFILNLFEINQVKASDNRYNLLCNTITGSFDTRNQSTSNKNFRLSFLEIVRIWEQDESAFWIYLEQSIDGMRNEPILQKIYRVDAINNDQFVLQSYDLPNPQKYVYQWTNPSFFNNIKPSELIQATNCSMILKWNDNGFQGEVEEKKCADNFRGSTYLSTKLKIEKDRIELWNQGFNSNNELVWGSKNGPYIFEKKSNILYPMSNKVDTADNYFGTIIADPYRWLEDEENYKVKEWVIAQNNCTNTYLEKLPKRSELRERYEKIWNFERRSSSVFNNGDEYYSWNSGLLAQNIIMRKTSQGRNDTVVNPNTFSKDGTISIANWELSKDGKYLCYTTSEGGSDWKTIHFMDAEKRHWLKDKLENIKFSGLGWYKDGLYYSRYDEVFENGKLSRPNNFLKLYYHKIGTEQKDDSLIFEIKNNSEKRPIAYLTHDEKFLILLVSQGTSYNALYAKYAVNATQEFIPIIKDFNSNNAIIGNIGEELYMRTDRNASNYKLVKFNINEFGERNWKTILPESKNVLNEVLIGGQYLVAKYIEDVKDLLVLFDLEGNKIMDIPLPGVGVVSELFAEPNNEYIYFSFSSPIQPRANYNFNLVTHKLVKIWEPKLPIELNNLTTHQVFYKSKDGTSIPMNITHKKDLVFDGNNPTILYGYGGFNLSIMPEFNRSILPFLEDGGIYVIANIRGGGEYGEDWHQEGMKEKKQNVFDDFIAAAEYLIQEKYTNPNKLGVIGRSNGGLLVGAVMTQRPDLFKVAIPTVGVLDMLRYHKFTIGWAWSGEYGDSGSENDFHNLIKYSPLHNIKQGIMYPATLVVTADRDDRVVPAHSYKFAATLQEVQSGTNPVLIRVDTTAGHGNGKTTSQTIIELADIWTFIYYHLGIN